MHRGRTVALHAADRPRGAGTLVRLQDLFGSMPVRRHALQPAAALQAVRLRLAGIALVRPDTTIALVDTGRGETLLRTPGHTGDLKPTFGRIFGSERAKELHRIAARSREPDMQLTGYISTGTHWTPELQVCHLSAIIGREIVVWDVTLLETKEYPRLCTHCVSSFVGQFLSINGRPIQESIILQALATLFGRSLLCQAPDLPSDARA